MVTNFYLMINIIVNCTVLLIIHFWIEYHSKKHKENLKPHVLAFMAQMEISPNKVFLKAFFIFYMFSLFNIVLSFTYVIINQYILQ